MPHIASQDLKKIIEKRVPLPHEMYINVSVPGRFQLMFQVRWWGQYRTYQAIPVVQSDGTWFTAIIIIEEPWFRYLKRKLRHDLGLRHVNNINPREKDNSRRIEQLIGIRTL